MMLFEPLNLRSRVQTQFIAEWAKRRASKAVSAIDDSNLKAPAPQLIRIASKPVRKGTLSSNGPGHHEIRSFADKQRTPTGTNKALFSIP